MPDITIEWWIYVVVLVGLVVLTLILHAATIVAAPDGSRGKRLGVATLFVGEDGRTSTSKLQAMLWTYAVLWALICLLVGAGVDLFSDALGDLREEYLLLLGGPYAAAIAAKGITASRVNGKPELKPPKVQVANKRTSATERLVEVVANDNGGLDLGDFQYFAFTLFSLTYFAWAFIDSPNEGLPAIPETLLVLTGVSLATYVGKKALPEAKPDASAPPPANGIKSSKAGKKNN